MDQTPNKVFSGDIIIKLNPFKAGFIWRDIFIFHFDCISIIFNKCKFIHEDCVKQILMRGLSTGEDEGLKEYYDII